MAGTATHPAVNRVYYVFSALGLIFVGVAFVAVFTGGSCDCDPPIGVGWSMTIAAVGTITWWVSRLATRSPRWLNNAAAVIGYVGTVGVLVFGLIRALSDAAEIIR